LIFEYSHVEYLIYQKIKTALTLTWATVESKLGLLPKEAEAYTPNFDFSIRIFYFLQILQFGRRAKEKNIFKDSIQEGKMSNSTSSACLNSQVP
jgi:hypothetical protein